MTGRDLIIYILQNNLENQPIFQNGKFLGFLTVSEAAAKFNVGTATIRVWFEFNAIDGVKIGDEIFISASTKLPKGINNNMSDEALATFIKKQSQKD